MPSSKKTLAHSPTEIDSGRDIYTVSRLNQSTKALLEASFPSIWVEGEISNLALPASGHCYFTLKDEQAQIRCALFRGQRRGLACEPANGQQVLVRARVSLYPGRGDYQLIVDTLEAAGEGALRRAFEQLKQKLLSEGLFDVANKRPLPALPRRIGIITSGSGAVLHDILTTLARRFPAIPLVLYPVAVQGGTAAGEIVAALRAASKRGDCDALILARGGGSLEDLWPFNEESVARALHACDIPIVTGIGHETDITIADWVADARAPTPTAAAELLSPDQADYLRRLEQLEQRLRRGLNDRLQQLQQKLDWLSSRLVHPSRALQALLQRAQQLHQRLQLAQGHLLERARARLSQQVTRLASHSPALRLKQLQLRCQHARQRLALAMQHHQHQLEQRFKLAVGQLQTLSPLATLARGYAIIQDATGEKILRDSGQVQPGSRIRARLAKGELFCVVESIKKGSDT